MVFPGTSTDAQESILTREGDEALLFMDLVLVADEVISVTMDGVSWTWLVRNSGADLAPVLGESFAFPWAEAGLHRLSFHRMLLALNPPC